MVGGPVDNLVRAFAVHLEAAEAAGCTPTTLKIYDGRYKRYLTFLLEQGHEPPFALELLNPSLLRQCANEIKARSAGARGGTSAARQFVGCHKAVDRWLYDEGYTLVVRLAPVRLPRSPESARMPFTADEVRGLIAATTSSQTGSRDAALILLLLDTGVRIGGALGLKVDDLDLRERRIRVRLKGGRDHVLYFGSDQVRDGGRSVRAMRRWLDERAAIVERWRDEPRGDRSEDRLFLSFDGWPLSSDGFNTALKRLAAEAEVAGPVFAHRFRHAFATEFLARHPGDEHGLRDILGHLSPSMYRTYVHISHELIARRGGNLSISEQWLGGGEMERIESASVGGNPFVEPSRRDRIARARGERTGSPDLGRHQRAGAPRNATSRNSRSSR